METSNVSKENGINHPNISIDLPMKFHSNHEKMPCMEMKSRHPFIVISANNETQKINLAIEKPQSG